MTKTVNLRSAPEPVVEIPKEVFTVGKEIYPQRLGRLREKMQAVALDYVVIYADKEHGANFSYLTGFAPRFEEALLIVAPSGMPKVLLGTENLCMADYASIDLEAVHFPSFGLIGQPRVGTQSLQSIIKDAGIARGMAVGTVGWKYFTEEDGCPADSLEIPHYLAEALRDAVGDAGSVVNVTHFFMSPVDGFRTRLEAEQILAYEYAACLVSKSMLDLMNGVEVGVSEMELAAKMQNQGLPLSCHQMVSVGEKARFGLTSPSARRAELGDFMTAAFGIEGALNCRGAYIARSEQEVPENWLENIAIPYFSIAVKWLESVGIGAEGGPIYAMVEEGLPQAYYGWELNPGHLIATDEWVSTPFMSGSSVKLQSGNYIQFDLIISPQAPFFGADAEDGIVIADQELRDEIRALSPEAWARFERRREYIDKVLGIKLKEEILPMSDLLGYYRPFLLDKETIFTLR